MANYLDEPEFNSLGLWLIHLRNTIRIESLGHGKRLRLWVELGLKTYSCNPLISLCKVTHHYSGMEDCSLPQTRLVFDWTG